MKTYKAIGLTAIICIILTSSLWYVFGATPTASIWISNGNYPGAPTYTIFKDGSNYYAKDANGQIDYSGTNCTQVVTSCVGTMRSIFFAEGTFTVDSPIVLASTMEVYANSMATIIKVKANTDFPVASGIFMATDKVNIAISGFILEGNKANQQTTGFQRGIVLMNCTNVLIKDCGVVNSVFAGIDIMGCREVVISNCMAMSNGKANNPTSFGVGFYVRQSGSRESQNVSIINCQAFGNGDSNSGDGGGFIMLGKGHIAIANSISIFNERYGIKSQCGNLSISNCDVSHNFFGLSISTGFDANTTIVNGIRAINCSSYGIYITCPATIRGGVVGDSGATGIIGASTSGYFEGLIIEGFYVYGCVGNGIKIQGIGYTVISTCQAFDNGVNGIEFDDYGSNPTNNSIISSCQAWGNGGYGFRETSGAIVDYNLFLGCNSEGNTIDGIPLTGANSRVFSCWNGTHWRNDSP